MSRKAPLPRPIGRRALLLALTAGFVCAVGAVPRSTLAKAPPPRGRPTVTLDRLVLPEGLANDGELARHLKFHLRREARRADWGAGARSKIEFRFIVEELSIRDEGAVLRIRCTALGRLPRGKSARSRIEYGGDPKRRVQEVKKVLEIVARGVMTRLAELERHRRLGS